MKRMIANIPGYMGKGVREIKGWGEGHLMVSKSGKYWLLYHIPSGTTIGSTHYGFDEIKTLAERKDEILQLNQMDIDWSRGDLDSLVAGFKGTREEFVASVVDITGTQRYK